MQKKILVSGGLGYIGSNTVVELMTKGNDVVIVDNLSNSKESIIEDITKITHKPPIFYNSDIGDANLLDLIFSQHGNIDVIFHFAGLKKLNDSIGLPLSYYDSNVSKTLILLHKMQEYNIKNLIFSSSASVYGDGTPPYSESSTVGIVNNPYARTKYFIEQILHDLYISDPTWNITVLRYFNPIGAHELGLLGDISSGSLFSEIQQVALGYKNKLTVFGNKHDTPDGFAQRDFIHVTDLADGHLATLNKLNGFRIYNLGVGHPTSIMEVIRAFEQASKLNIPIEIQSNRIGDVDTSYATVDLANSRLSWFAKRDVLQAAVNGWHYCQNVKNSH